MNPDIEALIHKAKKSLGAARSLIKDNYFDFAASRAYYAMFYIAEALLARIGQSYNKHSAVIFLTSRLTLLSLFYLKYPSLTEISLRHKRLQFFRAIYLFVPE